MYNKRLGIAIYPEKIGFEETIEYMEMSSKNGVERLYATFLQLNMFHDNKEELLETYKECFKRAKELGFEIAIDVAKKTLVTLGVENNDLKIFSDLGIDVIRFDATLSPGEMAELTYNQYNIKIELQMSNEDNYIKNFITYKPKSENVWGCHNFYPQRYTGLELDKFLKTSEDFIINRFRTTSYLSSNNKNSVSPWPLNEGAPTLEICRDLPSHVQAQIMWATGVTDDLIFSNAPALESEIKILKKLNPYIISLEVEIDNDANDLEKKICLEEKHFNRADTTKYFKRSTQSRVKYIKNENPPRIIKNKEFFEVGEVVIGNNDAGLYKNEMQIISKKIPYNPIKNVVGKVKESNLFLLDFIDSNKRFNLVKGFD